MSTRKQQTKSEGASLNRSTRSSAMARPLGAPTVRGTTVSFTNPATIADSGNGLAVFPVGALLEVQGSPRNSREFRVTASAAGSLTVVPAVVTSEAATPIITLRRLG